VLSREELWRDLGSLVESCGLELFDLELPGRQVGTLRVYITKPVSAPDRVSVEDCEVVSRKFRVHKKLGALLQSYSLEVSSPGINRQLRLPEHFRGAVGERVQLRVKSGGWEDRTLVGELLECQGTEIAVRLEGSGEEVRFGMGEISKARVDFLFSK